MPSWPWSTVDKFSRIGPAPATWKVSVDREAFSRSFEQARGDRRETGTRKRRTFFANLHIYAIWACRRYSEEVAFPRCGTGVNLSSANDVPPPMPPKNREVTPKIVDDFVVVKALKFNKLQQASTRRRHVLVLQVLGNRLFPNSGGDCLGQMRSGVYPTD